MGKNQSKLSKEDMEVLHRETGMDKTDIEVRAITRMAISKIQPGGGTVPPEIIVTNHVTSPFGTK